MMSFFLICEYMCTCTEK